MTNENRATFSAHLLARTSWDGGILGLTFTRPEGYGYRAGQWCFLNLPDLGFTDDRGLRRHLSLTTAPAEGELGFATKLSDSAFKKTLNALEVGAEIEVEPARGKFTLPEDDGRPLCFLAGGIGITPFRAMAFEAAATGRKGPITLLYSSRTPEETPFLEDFQKLDGESDTFTFAATMTRMQNAKRTWEGREGRMDAAMIREVFPPLTEGAFYIAGPPKMVEMIHEMVRELGVPEERVTEENFAGA